jgi:hypothetical protein
MDREQDGMHLAESAADIHADLGFIGPPADDDTQNNNCPRKNNFSEAAGGNGREAALTSHD